MPEQASVSSDVQIARLRAVLGNCLDFIGSEEVIEEEFNFYAKKLCQRICNVLGLPIDPK